MNAIAASTRERGAAVEAAACAYLIDAGLREVAANAGSRVGEIDLVMRDGDTLVFVEVRYRRNDRFGFGGGGASVDVRKRRKLIRAAQVFLVRHRQFTHAPCRFDVVEADGDPRSPRLHWIRDAFRADDV